MATKNKQQFDGKHMAAILVAGFGIVAVVNFYMASLAAGGFHGVVVENSYVASQKFNDWLVEAEEARSLGWEVEHSRDEAGHVIVHTVAVPERAQISANLRRPIGEREYADLTFARVGDDLYRSNERVENGRWTMRLYIEAGGQKWADESELAR